MKFEIAALIALYSGCAVAIDVSVCASPRSISVTSDDAVLVELESGPAAMVQFTKFARTEATYRWSFRNAPLATPQSGVGRVFENYYNVELPGRDTVLVPKDNGESLKVKAGEIWLEWSYHNKDSAWLYYCEGLAKLKVLPASAFDSKL